MFIHPYHADIDRQRWDKEREAARLQRLVSAGQPPRRVQRVVGRLMIRIGSRLADDRSRQWARSD